MFGLNFHVIKTKAQILKFKEQLQLIDRGYLIVPDLISHHLRSIIFLQNMWFRSSVIALIFLVLFFSCRDHVQEECLYDTANENGYNIVFEQLESDLPTIKTKQELVDFFSNHTTIRDYFFNRIAYPNDSAFINQLHQRFTNPYFDTLLQETKRVFGNGLELKQELSVAFGNMKFYYPDFQVPKIETIISGMENDFYLSDSLIVIGLDFFLGKGAKYRPNMYEYLLRRYEKEFIVPSIMLVYGIDGRYNETDLADRTVLADMIAYGKAYYFAKHMLPCTPDSVLMGYTAEEIAGARANQDKIWKKMVEDEAFYSTSQQMKQRYIGERPKTYELGDKAPGRLGPWMGWQIVNKYAERNSDLTLPQIMKVKDAKLIFTESKYKPID
jgi:hypothetical protein